MTAQFAMFLGEWGERLSLTLAHTLWQSLLIAFLLFLSLRILPVRFANRRYAVTLVALSAVLLSAFVTLSVIGERSNAPIIAKENARVVASVSENVPFSSMPTPLSLSPPSPQSFSPSSRVFMDIPAEAEEYEAYEATFQERHSLEAPPVVSSIVSSVIPGATSRDLYSRLSPWACVAWMAGVAAMIVRMAFLLVFAGAARRRSVAIREPALLAMLDDLARTLGMAKAVRVATADFVKSPVVLGILRPMVLLPASALTGIPKDHLRAILAHELAHIRRYDYLINLLQMLVEALLFFNPAVWWISRQIRVEREACCDSLAAGAVGGNLHYATALAGFAEVMGAAQARSLETIAPAFGESPRSGRLLDRVKRIALPRYRPPLRVSWYSLASFILVGGLMLAFLQVGTAMTASVAADLVQKEIPTPEPVEEPVEEKELATSELVEESVEKKELPEPEPVEESLEELTEEKELPTPEPVEAPVEEKALSKPEPVKEAHKEKESPKESPKESTEEKKPTEAKTSFRVVSESAELVVKKKPSRVVSETAELVVKKGFPTPKPPPEPVVTVQVTWDDSNQPIDSVTVTLTPISPASGYKGSLSAVSAPTDYRGRATLRFPAKAFASGPLACKVEVDDTGGKALSTERYEFLPGSRVSLRLERTYTIYGTVYWKPEGSKDFVPAPQADVSIVQADPKGGFYSTRSDDYKMASATTDSKGRYYTTKDVPQGPVRLWARLGAHVTPTRPNPVLPAKEQPSGPFDIYLERGKTLTALVRDKATLKPIANATVEAKFQHNSLVLQSTDANGLCKLEGLPLGSVKILVGAPGYAYEPVPLQISSDNSQNQFSITLDKGGKARICTVFGKEGAPVGDVSFLVSCGKLQLPGVTDANGFALVEGLPLNKNCSVSPTGRHSVTWVSLGNGTSRSYCPDFTVDGQKISEVTLPVRNKGARRVEREQAEQYESPIAGKVVNEAGDPVAGALVTASSNSNRGVRMHEYRMQVSTLTNFAGEFEINYQGGALLRAEANGYLPVRKVKTVNKKETEIVLSKKITGDYAVRVLDSETKKPVTDYRIAYSPDMRAGRDVARVLSTDGRTVLNDLTSNKEYTFYINSTDHITKRTTWKPDGKELDILLDPQKELIVNIIDADSGKPISGVEARFSDFPMSFEIRNDRTKFAKISYNKDYPKMVTNSKGVFTFKNASLGGSLIFLPEGYDHFALRFSRIDRYKDPKTGEIVIPLEKNPTGSISVQVFFEGKEIIYDYSQYLKLLCGNTETRRKFPKPVFRDGAYHFENLPAGEYRVYARALEREENFHHPIRRTFQLARGEQKSIKLGDEDFATLSGKILKPNGDPYPPSKISFGQVLQDGGEVVYNSHSASYSCESDENGNYKSHYMTPGKYSLYLQGTNFRRTVEVKGNTVRDWTIPKETKTVEWVF